jgi:hypothetical protein
MRALSPADERPEIQPALVTPDGDGAAKVAEVSAEAMFVALEARAGIEMNDKPRGRRLRSHTFSVLIMMTSRPHSITWSAGGDMRLGEGHARETGSAGRE